MLFDIRYACRSLLRAPGFTIVVVATLALGIGATLTMFSLMRAVLWRALPYPDPQRIITIRVDARNVPHAGATIGEVYDLRARAKSFELVSMSNEVDANLVVLGESEHLRAASVSDDFLPLLGAHPALGRTLDSRAPGVVISDELWRRRFAADPHIVGRAARINDQDREVAGVLAPGFRAPSSGDLDQIDVWFPATIDAVRTTRGVPVMARLAPGVTVDEANAELAALAGQFMRDFPQFYAGGSVRFTARRLHDEMTSEARPALWLLSGAVGFVLLIACVNVANLTLARGAARERELDIRRALGAGRGHIIRRLLTESLLLALAAAVIGLLAARVSLAVIASLASAHIPLQSRVAIDWPVATFALLLSAATSILFGLLPALRLSSSGAARTHTSGLSARRLQRALVVAEVALSIVPLTCAGLMLRTFENLTHSPLGFDPVNVVTAKISINMRKYSLPAQKWTLLRQVLDGVRGLPGVDSASAASPLPLADQERRRVGRAEQTDTPPILATQQIAIPGYLATIGTPLLYGRDFRADEIVPGTNVTIIDERLATRLWPHESALGKRLSVFRTGWRHDLEVIGVTSTVHARSVRDDDLPHYVMPYGLWPVEMSLVIRTRASASQMAPGIRAAVEAAHGGRAAFDIKPLSEYVADSIGDTRFLLFVLGAFAAAAILLAAVGLYGTLAYLTAQRTREFGIRLALGSSLRAIAGIVLRESALLAAAGTSLGLLGGALATRAIREQLYQVRPLDAITLGTVAALVGIVALVAASVPAWRAARVDPQVLLRSE